MESPATDIFRGNRHPLSHQSAYLDAVGRRCTAGAQNETLLSQTGALCGGRGLTEVSTTSDVSTRVVDVPNTFSLRKTCAPVWWVKHRSPRHAWLADSLIVVEMTGDSVVWREVSQPGTGFLHIT